LYSSTYQKLIMAVSVTYW